MGRTNRHTKKAVNANATATMALSRRARTTCRSNFRGRANFLALGLDLDSDRMSRVYAPRALLS
jgi:hypothetical protein